MKEIAEEFADRILADVQPKTSIAQRAWLVSILREMVEECNGRYIVQETEKLANYAMSCLTDEERADLYLNSDVFAPCTGREWTEDVAMEAVGLRPPRAAVQSVPPYAAVVGPHAPEVTTWPTMCRQCYATIAANATHDCFVKLDTSQLPPLVMVGPDAPTFYRCPTCGTHPGGPGSTPLNETDVPYGCFKCGRKDLVRE